MYLYYIIPKTNSFRLASNVSACQGHQAESQINQFNEILFWAVSIVCILVVLFGVIANILVIYFAHQEPWTGTLRYLNKAVKHLAIADLLYGVLGIPLTLSYWKMGKNKPLPE